MITTVKYLYSPTRVIKHSAICHLSILFVCVCVTEQEMGVTGEPFNFDDVFDSYYKPRVFSADWVAGKSRGGLGAGNA